jgi:hypothetical protein
MINAQCLESYRSLDFSTITALIEDLRRTTEAIGDRFKINNRTFNIQRVQRLILEVLARGTIAALYKEDRGLGIELAERARELDQLFLNIVVKGYKNSKVEYAGVLDHVDMLQTWWMTMGSLGSGNVAKPILA